MNLIDEIERAAKAAMTSVIEDDAEYDDARAAMLLLRANRRWARIRAALEAAEDMVNYMESCADEESQHGSGSRDYAPRCPLCRAVDRFRAATREAK